MTSSTVNDAFKQFMTHAVRLNPTVTDTARRSRDWLIDQIETLPEKDTSFPLLYRDAHNPFGSFSRRTKCRELDDIDLIIAMVGGGGQYNVVSGTTCAVYVPDGHRLAAFRDATDAVNSRLVINQFIRSLSEVAQYRSAEMKRNGSAAILDLTSYNWVYDIVPAFLTTEDWNGRSYYLIPDGNGQWKKTDPRKDRERATAINQDHGGFVLDVIRLVKLLLKRTRGLTLSSYLTEALVLNHYDRTGVTATRYMDLNLQSVLGGMANLVSADVNDPKDIDGNINHLDWTERWAAKDKLQQLADASTAAYRLESSSQTDAIAAWKDILGDDFGEY